MSERLEVGFWPPWPKAPYLAAVATGVEIDGVHIEPLRLRSIGRYEVVHLHWPDLVWAARNPLRRIRSSITVAIARAVTRRRCVPFVVTCHNLDHHEGGSAIGGRVQRALTVGADHRVVLTRSGVERLTARFPEIDPDTISVIRHPLFTDRYRTMTAEAARRTAPFMPGRPDGGQLWLHFGKIRPYKGLAELIASLRAVPDLPVRLVLLGERYPRGTQNEVVEAAASDDRIVHIDRWVDDDEISAACSLADAVIAPYLRAENSGVALTALTLGTPVVAPSIGSFPELRDELGDWLQTYDPPVDAAEIYELAERARRAEPSDLRPYEVNAVGRDHAELYRSLAGNTTTR